MAPETVLAIAAAVLVAAGLACAAERRRGAAAMLLLAAVACWAATVRLATPEVVEVETHLEKAARLARTFGGIPLAVAGVVLAAAGRARLAGAILLLACAQFWHAFPVLLSGMMEHGRGASGWIVLPAVLAGLALLTVLEVPGASSIGFAALLLASVPVTAGTLLLGIAALGAIEYARWPGSAIGVAWVLAVVAAHAVGVWSLWTATEDRIRAQLAGTATRAA